jgi:hypothetical protein
MIASFKYWYNSSFFPCTRKILLGQAEVKYMPKNRNKSTGTTFYDKTSDIIKSDRFGRH